MPDAPPAATTRRSIFLEFMAKVARFEELADGGRRFLVSFQQELEYFRRPRVPGGSDVMSEIVRSNCSDRVKSYLEAGCSLHCRSISNLNQLHSCEGELEDHVNKVNVLLKELQCLVEDAYDATLTGNLSAIEVSGNATIGNNKMSSESFAMEEKEQQLGHQLDSDSSLVTMMILVHNMLKLDYMMQEKIVRTLSLKSSSPELEAYCLMWELRPYLDDDLMNLAWKMCR